MSPRVRILGIITIAVAIGITTVCLFRDSAPVQADGVLGLNFACTDGEFVAPGGTSVIDLGLAVNAPWDAPSSGNGVYDADRWAVVFKFSSIRAPNSHGRSENPVETPTRNCGSTALSRYRRRARLSCPSRASAWALTTAISAACPSTAASPRAGFTTCDWSSARVRKFE